MGEDNAARITTLLDNYQSGDTSALDALVPLVYDKLHHIASRQLRFGAQTISPTVLVHELFLKLRDSKPLVASNSRVFFLIAGRCMRQVLIDLVRRKNAARRGGQGIRVTFDERVAGSVETPDMDLGAISEALEKLSKVDDRLSKVVELRFLVGLSIEETALALDSSPMTVKRDWALARAWLLRELKREE